MATNHHRSVSRGEELGLPLVSPLPNRLSDPTGLQPLPPVLRKSFTSTAAAFPRRLSLYEPRNNQIEGKDPKEEPTKPNAKKRMSLFLPHNPFPGLIRPDDYPFSRKSETQIREEVALLQTLGVKSAAAVPSELHIFKNRPTRHLVMSCFDLWGPNHAKTAFRSMGYSEAFMTMECRDKREGLALESVLTAKFNPRMADDVSTMKALNAPMARTGRNLSAQSQVKREVRPVPGKSQALLTILRNCDQLQAENRVLRKKMTPSQTSQELRRLHFRPSV